MYVQSQEHNSCNFLCSEIVSEEEWFWKIVATLHAVNHSCNFFLYMVSGQQFRQCFLEVVCSCCGIRRLERTQTIQTSTTKSVSVASTSKEN